MARAVAVIGLAGTVVPARLVTRSAALVYEGLSPHTAAAGIVGAVLLAMRAPAVRPTAAVLTPPS